MKPSNLYTDCDGHSSTSMLNHPKAPSTSRALDCKLYLGGSSTLDEYIYKPQVQKFGGSGYFPLGVRNHGRHYRIFTYTINQKISLFSKDL